MKYKEMLELVKNLDFEKKQIICKDESGVELYIKRPHKPSASLKNEYDAKINFQIWLKEGDREFMPNHLRLMIDLNLRTRTRIDLKRKLLLAFDKIYYGEDPEKAVTELKKEKFEHYLNSITVIAHMAQLFLIEQEINYLRESKFEPKNLFFQGWIREFIDSPKEIDNLCMSVARGQPPKANYTNKENKKNKKHENNLKELWYL